MTRNYAFQVGYFSLHSLSRWSNSAQNGVKRITRHAFLHSSLYSKDQQNTWKEEIAKIPVIVTNNDISRAITDSPSLRYRFTRSYKSLTYIVDQERVKVKS